MASVFEYRVHPAVGIARMGNSETTYFLTQEKPWKVFEPTQRRIPGAINKVRVGASIRDTDDRDPTAKFKMCKQGARFRVFCYQYDQVPVIGSGPAQLALTNVWECKSDKYEIEWTAQVANLKASKVTAASLGDVVDTPRVGNVPDPVVLKTKIAGHVNALRTFTGKRVAATDPNGRLDLGSCFVDSDGRLTVLGSDGKIKRMDTMTQDPVKPGSLFWSGWEDDTGDGPVTAKVKPKAGNGKPDAGKPQKDALGAWVVINMPDYGADARAPTNLYDLAINHAYEIAKGGSGFTPNIADLISFTSQIRPLMFAQYAVRYTIRHHDSLSPYNVPTTAADTRTKNPLLSLSLRAPRLTKKLKPESIWEAYKGGLGLGSVPGNASNGPSHYITGQSVSIVGGMPWLNFVTVTEIQRRALSEFDAKRLNVGSTIYWLNELNNEKYAPMQLDRAHMETMSGGSFYPGIETGRQVGYPGTWLGYEGCCDEHYDVRVTKAVNKAGTITGDAQAGYLTHELANPWHGDFIACDGDYWPHSRPIKVQVTAGGGWKDWMSSSAGDIPTFAAPAGAAVTGGLADNWWKLGFVRYDPASKEMLEMERSTTLGISP